MNKGLMTLSNKQAECKISPWGANLVSYRPRGEEDVFWLGALNKFDRIHSIRGGVPISWPRFAEEELNSCFPRHGFARVSDWRMVDAEVDEAQMKAEFLLIPDQKYNLDASLRLVIKVTDCLEYALETTNNSDMPLMFSEALHAYFNVGSLDAVAIKGLSGQRYRNALDGQFYTLDGDLHINGEFDAAFVDHTGRIEIVDATLKRSIIIEKESSNTTVVWNPGKDLAEMSSGQYKNFVCVEPANQGASFVRLDPHETHRIAMKIRLQK